MRFAPPIVWQKGMEFVLNLSERGIYGPMTSYSQWDIAVVAAFDLDLRRNFDPSIASRFGERPIIHVPNLHPQAWELVSCFFGLYYIRYNINGFGVSPWFLDLPTYQSLVEVAENPQAHKFQPENRQNRSVFAGRWQI